MAFITLLATAVSIVFALGLMLVGLVEAPWQLLLVGLLAALYGLQRQSWASQSVAQLHDSETGLAAASDETPRRAGSAPEHADSIKSNPSTEEGNDGYELTYRGIRYRTSKPTLNTSSSERVEQTHKSER